MCYPPHNSISQVDTTVYDSSAFVERNEVLNGVKSDIKEVKRSQLRTKKRLLSLKKSDTIYVVDTIFIDTSKVKKRNLLQRIFR